MGKTTAISTADEQEIAEARGTTVPDMLYDVVARAATTSVGQFIYKRVDNLLWTIEKTARWSLPQPSPAAVSSKASAAEESEDIGGNISGPPLIRPLPWLLFLPALIALRMVRSALSMGARFVGRGPVLPSSVVGFLQNKRRKLRALKYRGQRLQRIAKVEQEADPKQVTWLQRIILPLRMVICTRPYSTFDANSDVAHAVIFRKDRPSSTGQKRVVSKKRNLNQREAESAEEEASDEDSFEDAGCKELLDKYAHEEDSSFNMEEASSASSDGTDSSLSDADPSPKKPTLDSDNISRPQQQHSQPKQNGAQQPPSKADALKRSSSENKNGVESQPSVPKPSTQKNINAGNRSKSAADLENGNVQSSHTAAPDGKNAGTTNMSSHTTPSKSIPNLSSSPENNENKPINQNVSGGPTVAAASQIKSPSPTVLKATGAKQSPTMSEVRTNFQQQKQASQKLLASSGAAAHHQQQSQQSAPQQQQQQQYVGNGAKSRNKKGPTQPVA
ncbi:uncharacterized protein LOC128301201 [Anopheles moucheti]|uniref:uncharacterized protein LOC128301201 n=1 Tax=Anopheles moucheti TaxID=186751 RepID=UPI0022F0D995|nr:uncharacterized protein LOC128301201 [Anopheles moucheti]XP_052893523.1 uncharacterized protein LOC128301201 [Anopheles moucheti]